MADEQVTIQEIISEKIYKYGDICDNSDVTSEEHKEAHKCLYEAIDYLLKANKQADDKELAWEKLNFDREQANKQAKREVKSEIIKSSIAIATLLLPKLIDITMQHSAQRYAATQMYIQRNWEEEGNRFTTSSENSAWRLVEKSGPKL